MPKRNNLGRCRMCGKKLRQKGNYCSIHSRAISEVRIRFKKKGIIDEKIILAEAIRISNIRSDRIKNKVYPKNRSGNLPRYIKCVEKDNRLGVKNVSLLPSNMDVPI